MKTGWTREYVDSQDVGFLNMFVNAVLQLEGKVEKKKFVNSSEFFK